MQHDPEEYNAEDPEAFEAGLKAARAQTAELDGARPLVDLLESSEPKVLTGAGSALFNLCLDASFALSVRELGALPKLQALTDNPDLGVQAVMLGVLMNCCASSEECRSDLVSHGLLAQVLAVVTRSEISGTQKNLVTSTNLHGEVLAAALALLNNVLLDDDAARRLRSLGGLSQLMRLLKTRKMEVDESVLEDAASSLLRVVQEDQGAAPALFEMGAMPKLVEHVESANEELQVRVAGLLASCCAQVGVAREELHKLGTAGKLLPLLSSGSEEVQEAGAMAVQQISLLPAAAREIRRKGGVPALIDLMASLDPRVQFCAVSATMNVAIYDPKAAAAIREAEGLRPLVYFLGSGSPETATSAALTVEACAVNESNKTLLRELGAIEALLAMASQAEPGAAGGQRNAQAAALGALANLCLNEDEARVLLRLQGGLRKLQPLLFATDELLQSKAAEVIYHCAPNAETKVSMRILDILKPLVALLASPSQAARLAAAGGLMCATQNETTNQLKCRELGAISPLLSLLVPPKEGPPDAECQRRAAWSLSNVAAEPAACMQLRVSADGFSPLVHMIEHAPPDLQRPAAACLFNATANDPLAAQAALEAGMLPPTMALLRHAREDANADLVAWAAGVVLNTSYELAAPFGALLLAEHPGASAALLACLSPGGSPLQNSNASGALMNICATSEAHTQEVLAKNGLQSLLEVLASCKAADQEGDAVAACHAAGALANLARTEAAVESLLSLGGAKTVVEALEGETEEAVRAAAACVLNAAGGEGNAHAAIREEMVEAGGVATLVATLASPNVELKLKSLGALLNLTVAGSAAEAVRDASVDVEAAQKLVSTGGFEMLVKQLSEPEPMLRARAAGVLFNCAGFGPDNRLAMLEQGTLAAVVEALGSDPGRGSTDEVRHMIEARLVGVLLNAALNPTTRVAVLELGGLKPLVGYLASHDPTVLATATTAIAYLNDKAEHRPGALDSALRSSENAARLTYHKQRFHGGAAAAAAADASLPADAKPVEPDGDEEAPGARSKALYGTLPMAKLGATHDSKAKGPRFDSEAPAPFVRMEKNCVQPEMAEEPYEEVPSPLASPRDDE